MDMNNASVNINGLLGEKLIGTDFLDYYTNLEKARAGYEEIFAKVFVSDYSFYNILMDLEMPEMNGCEVTEYICNIDTLDYANYCTHGRGDDCRFG